VKDKEKIMAAVKSLLEDESETQADSDDSVTPIVVSTSANGSGKVGQTLQFGLSSGSNPTARGPARAGRRQ
jgi:hypothetical protein